MNNLTKALQAMAKTAKQSAKRAEAANMLVDPNQVISVLKMIEMLTNIHQGDKGDTPVKGKDYFTAQEAAIFLKMATPVKGKHYFTTDEINKFIEAVRPVKGQDYFDGIDGQDGVNGVANMSEVDQEIAKEMTLCMDTHKKEFDHKLIHDSKMIGELEVDVSTIQEGDIIQRKGNKLVGVKIKIPDVSGLRNYVAQQGVSNIRSFTVTQNIQLDAMGLYCIDASLGNVTVTLPSASGRENTWFEILRLDDSSNTVTITPSGSETMSGMTTFQLTDQWSTIQLFAYSNNYLIRNG